MTEYTMRFWKLLVLFALATSCDCGDDNNTNNTTDTGSDVSENNVNNRPDTGDDQGGDDAGTDDMAPDMSLPDGLNIPGLSAPVTVEIDAQGVLHLDCATDEDCAAVQGYYHAKHRFAQMDLQRRVAAGTISALVGDLALGFDVEMRLLLSTRDGQPLASQLLEASTPKTRGLFTAYTAGVNAWITDWRVQRNDARLPAEYEIPLIDSVEIPDWTEEDSIFVALLLLEGLSNSSGGDLGTGEAYANMTPEEAFDIGGMMSGTQYGTMPDSGETYSRPNTATLPPSAGQLSPVLSRMNQHKDVLTKAKKKLDALYAFRGIHKDEVGSNNWLIGPSLTQSGAPILANDPHLGLTNPALWYLVEIDAVTNGTGNMHVAGVSLPGLPGILLGHNENISWGATVMFYDLADVYIEELSADGNSVIFNGQEVPITTIDVTFKVARDDDFTTTLRWVPHHGPVIEYDPANNRAVSIRWVGNDATTDADMFYQLAEASNMAEAQLAIRNSTSTNQNWIVADRDGNIGWFPYSAVPERPWASLALPPWAPLPGDGSAEWGPTIDYDELPQMMNPASGFIATANTDPVGTSFDGDPTNDGYGYLFSGGELIGLRQQAIVDQLNLMTTNDMHTTDAHRALQGDDYMVMRDYVMPAVNSAVANGAALSADGQALYDNVVNWDGTCPTGIMATNMNSGKDNDPIVAAASIGCSIFHYLATRITINTFEDELEDTSLNPSSIRPLRTLLVALNRPGDLQNAAGYWDDIRTVNVETQDEIILAAIEEAFTLISTDSGSTDPDDWRWGRFHGIELFANLLDTAGIFQFNVGPLAAPGGFFTINVANPRSASTGDWTFRAGPSMRHISEFGPNGITSYWTLPGGQVNFPDSDYYNSLLNDWIDVNHFEMLFDRAEVTAAAVETFTVDPR